MRQGHGVRRDLVKPTADYLDIVGAGRLAFDLGDEDLDVPARGDRPAPIDAVFVYGTLMRGEARFGAFTPAGLRCILLAECPGRLVDLGEYPGLVLGDADRPRVRGEFIRHAGIGTVLERLDHIEGFLGFGAGGSLYRRTLVDVGVGDGRVRQAWTYVCADDAAGPVIASGDWRVHRGERQGFLARLVDAYCAGNELAVARAIAARGPFPPVDGMDRYAQTLLPLPDALDRAEVSERALAQATDKWVVIP